jgi:molecular chaperone DnaJ
MNQDYYAVLGVARDADQDTIKKAYRKLAMQYHPDKNPGDHTAEEKFKEAAKAYEVLGNRDKRARYDRFGPAGVDGFGGGAGGGFQDVSDIFDAFGDIFGDFFGGTRGGGGTRGRRPDRTRPQRGSDLRYRMAVTLQEVMTGTQKNIEFETDADCDTCRGTGSKNGAEPTVCSTCAGRGQVVRSQGFFQMATTCPTCHGEGLVITDPCTTCRGQGRLKMPKKLAVNVPAGVDTGTQLRLATEGEPGRRGGQAGDLYVEVQVQPDKRFVRREQNLYAPLEIGYLQALLGADLKVDTLTGEHVLHVPAGIQQGEWVQMPGQGLPSLRGGRAGDLVFEVQIKFPKKLGRDEEIKLREIAQSKGETVAAPKKGFFGRKS